MEKAAPWDVVKKAEYWPDQQQYVKCVLAKMADKLGEKRNAIRQYAWCVTI